MNDSELNGKVDEFVAALTHETNAPRLAEAKVPVTDTVNALTAKKKSLVAKSAEQETFKSCLKGKTSEVDEASTELYDEFSSRIDAVAGLVGKNRPWASKSSSCGPNCCAPPAPAT